MIKLKNLVYIRLGTADLATTTQFATKILGLEAAKQGPKALYLRSNQRAYTLHYTEGNPADQTIGMEVESGDDLTAAAAALDALNIPVHRGTAAEAAERGVHEFIAFTDLTGNRIELVVRPELSGRRYFPSRDAGITGFNHIGLCTTNAVRDEQFWTHVFNIRVSDRIADIPLMRITTMHHELALVPSPGPGVQHINHQVETTDDIMRNYYFLKEQGVPIVFGPGRHPTSGARFVYFKGPDGMVFEYSCGVDHIADEANHQPRQFALEPSSFCMWGAKPQGFVKTSA
jgi:2,3-dihydroxy-p-cumate/2,3-dihydroxybenzoate 3,4-dioxygenase